MLNPQVQLQIVNCTDRKLQAWFCDQIAPIGAICVYHEL